MNTDQLSRSYYDKRFKYIKFCSGGNWCVEIRENICQITSKKTPLNHKHLMEFCHGNLSMDSTPEEYVSLCV